MKGNQVNIPESGCGYVNKKDGFLYKQESVFFIHSCGNTNELGDAGESPGKSFLFFLTIASTMESDCLEIWLAVQAFSVKHHIFLWCPVRSRRPVKIRGKDLFSHLVVLITAAGLQGEQPLVDRIL